jgi:hypothetical protein
MARSPELEAILEAWFDFKHCSPDERKAKQLRLQKLLEETIAKTGIKGLTPLELRAALEEQYREYAKAKYREQNRKLSRLK